VVIRYRTMRNRPLRMRGCEDERMLLMSWDVMVEGRAGVRACESIPTSGHRRSNQWLPLP
jgi:hypothetical protein